MNEVAKIEAEAQDVSEHKCIAMALAAAQREMGKATKSSTNPHFRSKYADLGAVADACLPALNRHGIAVVQPFERDEHGQMIVTRFIHESGETLECPIPLILGKNDMQGLGSAMTYARRYGLMSLAGIAPEDDDGNAAAQNAPRTITADQFVRLRDKADEAGVPADRICAAYGAPSLEQFPAIKFEGAIRKLQSTIDSASKQKPIENAEAV